jgi:hypothetical protein
MTFALIAKKTSIYMTFALTAKKSRRDRTKEHMTKKENCLGDAIFYWNSKLK